MSEDISKEEYQEYWDLLEEGLGRKLKTLEVVPDGDMVNLNYTLEPVKFERIRRITGYLTGNTNTWNAAKQAELDDRVKHSQGIQPL